MKESRVDGVTFYDVKVEDLLGKDRALTLVYTLPQTRELYLACDIGLAPEKRTADFRFCVFDFKASASRRVMTRPPGTTSMTF